MYRLQLNQDKHLKGASKNALFLRLLRRIRARILMYDLYTPALGFGFLRRSTSCVHTVVHAVPPYTHKKITIFRSTLKYLLVIILAAMMNCALALSTDKQQDIEIEADTAEMDDIKGITIYRGDVVVIQGSIRMTGHTMTVYFNENDDMELVIMQGKPATYRQLPDDSKVYDEAEALQMEYYALKDYVILIDKALVTQEGLRFSGSRIEYDTVLSQVKAKGSTKTTKSDGAKKKNDGRVKITIKKKKQE